jgi:cytochrome d ubiquinol oxidase subunit II
MAPPILDLTPLWGAILALAVFLYVVLDGFDLGVGMLYGLAPDARSRTLMMETVAPIWDGNETWLVLGGLSLLAAFPLAYAIVMPAVYFPLLIMLLALVFRGTAFEFRNRERERGFWDHAFAWGSLVATFAQGVVLGAYIQGFKVEGRAFSGSSLDCFTPFSLLTGAALVFGYALLGAGWLVMKTEGDVQARARRQGRIALVGVLIGIAAVSVWTPLAYADIARRWFSWPNIAWLAPVPLATAIAAIWSWRAFSGRAEAQPFLAGLALFTLSYAGIGVSLYPMVVPHRFSLWQAASSESTQAFLAVGALFLLPIILMYSGWSYWVFRGKVRGDLGYH